MLGERGHTFTICMKEYKDNLRKKEDAARAELIQAEKERKRKEINNRIGDEEVYMEEGEIDGQEEDGSVGVETEKDEYYKIDVQDDEGAEKFEDIEESELEKTPGEEEDYGEEEGEEGRPN